MEKKRKLILELLPLLLLAILVFGIVLALVFSNDEGDAESEYNSRVLYGELVDGEEVAYFDTVCTIYDYSGMSSSEFASLCDKIETMTKKYHRLFDKYHHYDGVVNIKDINASAGTDALRVSRELFDFLVFCKEMHEMTDGECNIAMGAVLELWHDCREEAKMPGGAAKLPDDKAIAAALLHTDISGLVLSEDDLTVRLSDGEMSLDVGAVAKGYAVERIAEWLEAQGISGVVLDYGGNLRAVGKKPSGDGWRTGIVDPHNTSGYVKKFEIKDVSVVTSGDYERQYVVDGKKYHHIIDKETGYPAVGFSSVTVITKDSGLADALSTALFCLGNEKTAVSMLGRVALETGESIKVVLVDNAGGVTEWQS